MASIGYINIPLDVMIDLVKYLSFHTLKSFRVVALTNTFMKRELEPWIAREMKKRGVIFNVTEYRISNLATSSIMFLNQSTFDIGIEIPIEAYPRKIVNQIVTENSRRIREVNIFEDAPALLMRIIPRLKFVEKLRVSGLHYSDVTTLLIVGCLNSNKYLTTIELQLVQFPHTIFFPTDLLPNVINLKLKLCQGPGAASLLAAVESTVQNLELVDCYSRFLIPSSLNLPKIRELCIKTEHRGVRSLEVNLTRVGNSLEKLVLKGGVVLTPGFVLNEFPNVKTLVLENTNKGSGQEVLDACAQSVTAIVLVGMHIGHVKNRFPYLEYLKLEYCCGDLGDFLQNCEKISTLEVRDFELHSRLDRLMFNLKHAVINGKVVKVGKAPILKGGNELTIEIQSL